MTQNNDVVKKIINRAVEDAAFRELLFKNPDAALKEYELSDEQRKLFDGLNADSFDKFVGDLGDRTTKSLWIAGGG
ncbi:MAG: hypothetical protein KDE48_03335 [Anaerolineales bacterium]|nr:hypothetical protein [Anaerolineales bacterium]